jgi:hypothetical protein
MILLPPLFLWDYVRLTNRDKRELLITFSKVFNHGVSLKILYIKA